MSRRVWKPLAVGAAVIVPVAAMVLGWRFGLAAGMAVVACTGPVLAVLAIWRPWQARPALAATLSQDDGSASNEVVRDCEKPIAPIDRDAILDEQIRLAQATVPSRPSPVAGAHYLASLTDIIPQESYDDALERFQSELPLYENELGKWLAGWERARWLHAAFIEAWLRLENVGDAPASGVSMILSIPAGLSRIDSEPHLPLPPQRPFFERRSFPDAAVPGLKNVPDLSPPSRAPARSLKGPDYTLDGQRLFARFRADNVTHRVPELSAHPLLLVAEAPGRYEIDWEAHAAELSTPASGTFSIEVRDLRREGEPVTSLESLLETEEVRLVDPED